MVCLFILPSQLKPITSSIRFRQTLQNLRLMSIRSDHTCATGFWNKKHAKKLMYQIRSRQKRLQAMLTLTRVAAMLMHARATVFMHFSCTMMLQTVMKGNIFKSSFIHSFCLLNKIILTFSRLWEPVKPLKWFLAVGFVTDVLEHQTSCPKEILQNKPEKLWYTEKVLVA